MAEDRRKREGQSLSDVTKWPVGPAQGAETWEQRVGGLKVVPRLLAERGVDPATVLRAAHLLPGALDDPENRVPFIALAQMLTEAARQTRCQHFGLLVGREWRLADLGLLGELMRHSGSLGEAVRLGVIHQRVNSQGTSAFLREYRRSVSVGSAAFHPHADTLSATYDVVIALYTNVIRELCGPAWSPTEVFLPRSRPRDEIPYRQYFRCPVRFDAENAALTFPAALMSRPLPSANPTRKIRLEREALRHGDPHLLPGLYRSLRLLLLDGTARGDSLAQQLDMHRRTLNRRLKAQQTTFQVVLDDVRFAVSRQLLGETTRSIVEISHTLGYADASTFTRAFRRWSGMPPIAWRAKFGGQEPFLVAVQN
jgi:AraC-like DNA-binding protein